ncbi:Frequency clock protein [Metarhizium brunneum]
MDSSPTLSSTQALSLSPKMHTIDSAYASMSSRGRSLEHKPRDRRAENLQPIASDRTVDSYLSGIPRNLYPRHAAFDEKERNELPARRLKRPFDVDAENKMDARMAYPPKHLKRSSGTRYRIPEVSATEGQCCQSHQLSLHQDRFSGHTTFGDIVLPQAVGHCSNQCSGRNDNRLVSPNRGALRYDDSVVYYNGTSFFVDLSRGTEHVAYADCVRSGGQEAAKTQSLHEEESRLPLSRIPRTEDFIQNSNTKLDVGTGAHSVELCTDVNVTWNGPDEADNAVLRSNIQWHIDARPLEACGIGGIIPDDRFYITVTTERPSNVSGCLELAPGAVSTGEGIPVHPIPKTFADGRQLFGIKYLSKCTQYHEPVALPSPIMFLSPRSLCSANESEEIENTENGVVSDSDYG